MKNKAPGMAGQGRRAVNLKCDFCLFNSIFSQWYQAACRLIFLQHLIGLHFEPVLSLRLDTALQDMEALPNFSKVGGPVHISEMLSRVMLELKAKRERGAVASFCRSSLDG